MNCNPLTPSAVHSPNILPNCTGACGSRCCCALAGQKSCCVEWGLTWEQGSRQLLKVVLEPPCWLQLDAFCKLFSGERLHHVVFFSLLGNAL